MIKTFPVYMTPYGLERMIYLYLPDDWQTSNRRYPVIYMFDGHNLFSDETATYGTCWGLKEYLDAHPEYIVVGLDCNHEGDGRLREFCPYCFRAWSKTIVGTGRQTMDWMVKELKPMIDAQYPTLPDRAQTAIGGSSMGGLMSIYAAIAYNAVFSRAACLSPSSMFCMPQLRAELKGCTLDPDTRMYWSFGENELKRQPDMIASINEQLEFAREIQRRGVDLAAYVQPDGEHCEESWGKQIPRFMKILFQDM